MAKAKLKRDSMGRFLKRDTSKKSNTKKRKRKQRKRGKKGSSRCKQSLIQFLGYKKRK